MITKESLVDLKEKFEKVKKLIEEDARFDPETQPFLSKYAARQNLVSMNALLESLRVRYADSDISNKLLGMHAAVQLQLAIIAIDTEELSIGEQHLQKCSDIIDGNENLPEVASVNITMLNQMGILCAKKDPDIGQVHLEKAEAFFKTIQENNIAPIDYEDLFSGNDVDEAKSAEKFEKSYTLTLYYLAQIYGSSDPLKSAVYCHRTLERQLKCGDYDEIDWALNTATLSQFLMEKNGFKQARHHLSASLYMLEKHKTFLDSIELHDEAYDAKMETFRHRSADIARCWGKYGLILLTNSKNRLMDSTDTDVVASLCTDISEFKLEEGSTLTQEDLSNLYFTNLDLTEYESQITDRFILTLEDAKHVFLNAQKWLLKAQEYYTLDTLASDCIVIAQDHSSLYDLLVFFEENPDNRTKILKRAIDILENILDKVNPTYYMLYCRQIWFRLASLYSDVLDIKLDNIKESTSRPSPHALTKINNLVDKSSRHYKNFIDSLQKPGEARPNISEDVEKPYLQALFYSAALQSRYITLDKEVQLKNVEKSLENYQLFVDYCKKSSKAEEKVHMEMSVAKEMVNLLPLKIARLRCELHN